MHFDINNFILSDDLKCHEKHNLSLYGDFELCRRGTDESEQNGRPYQVMPTENINNAVWVVKIAN